PGIKRFFAETEVTDLPIFLDPKGQLARNMGVLGLPVTILIDPDGNELARLRGDADWNSDSARAIVTALIGEK
ncbi:MAG: TlpA family protein disulfide reductase, partial [Paracoccaceae bacterium]|nr:TlpA family protein disulfide reductase [Paracoccaceae bacterium]